MLALIFALPWFFLPYTHAPVEISKLLLAAALLGAAAVCFFADVFRRREIELPAHSVSVAVLVLVLLVSVSTAFSKAPLISLYGNFLAADSLMSFVLSGLSFFFASYFLSREDAARVAACFFAGVGLAAALGALQKIGVFLFPWQFTKSALFTPTGIPFFLGVLVVAMLVAASALLSLRLLSGRRRMYCVAAIGIALAALFVINNHYLWALTAVLGGAFVGIAFARGAPFRLYAALAVAAIVLALLNRPLSSLVTPAPFVVRPGVSATFSVAQHTLTGGRRALLGEGPALFGSAFTAGRPASLNAGDAWGIDYAQGHSFVLTLLITTGVLGLLAFLAALALAAWKVYRASRADDKKTLAVAAPTLFLAFSLFIFPGFFAQLLLVYTGMGLLAAFSAPKRKFSFVAASRPATAAALAAYILLIGVGVLSALAFGIKYAAAVRYGAALNDVLAGRGNEAVIALGKTVALDADNDEYLRAASQSSAWYALWLAAQAGAQLADIQASASKAIDAARRATEVHGVRAANWSNLAAVYDRLASIAQGAIEHAYKNYKAAWALDPANPQLPLDIARTLLLQGGPKEKQQEALDLITRSIALKPDYPPSRLFLAQLQLDAGAYADASRTIEELAQLRPRDASVAYTMGSLYYQHNRLEEARIHLKRAVELEPSFANARYLLGLLYKQQGEEGKAVQELQEVLKLNPQNADVLRALEGLKGYNL